MQQLYLIKSEMKMIPFIICRSDHSLQKASALLRKGFHYFLFEMVISIIFKDIQITHD
jgi:hypothetical protein